MNDAELEKLWNSLSTIEKQRANAMLNALNEGRSVRLYKPDMPSRKEIDELIHWMVPKDCGEQSCIVVAVTNKKVRDRLAEMYRSIIGWPPSIAPFFGAPVVLFLLADKSAPSEIDVGRQVTTLLLLGQYINRSLTRLSPFWLEWSEERGILKLKNLFEGEEGRAILKDMGITGEYEGIGHCLLGYEKVGDAEGDEPKAAPRKPGRVFYTE